MTELRPKSAALLRALAAAPGRTLSKAELLDAVWGDVHVTEDSLVQCVGDIRRALGPDRDALRTLAGRGYRLEPGAEHVALAPGARRLGVVALAGGLGVLALGVALTGPDAPPAQPDRSGPTVAVMPFENLSGEPRWDLLARGVTEEVIADLAANDWIFVLADATTRPLAGVSPQALRRDLGVGQVVTGSLQVASGRVRVTAALTETSGGRHRWAKAWEGPDDDLLELQAAAAEALTGELAAGWSGAIAGADRDRARRAATDSLAAYELYLLGVEHKHRFTLEDYDIAEEYLHRAVALDPQFARAWVVLAIIQGFRSTFAKSAEELAAFDARHREYALKAYAAAPDDPSVLLEMSFVHAADGDLVTAELAIRRAVDLAPNDADVLAVAAWSAPERAPVGADAVAWAERAEALNPGGPDWYAAAKGTAAFGAGDYDLAAEAFSASPAEGNADRWMYLAAAESLRGNLEEARAAAAELRRQVPGFDVDVYLGGWPWEPGLRERLREGVRRAGLGGEG